MIETTYIRLAQAAEVLGTDQGTLLIAGAEARIELHGLFNQIVRAVKKEHVATDAPWEVDTVIVDQARMRISFVPLQPHSCAELIRKGDTGEIQYLTDIGGDGIAWEVDEDIDVGYIPLDLIFVKRGDIEAIKSEHATPAQARSRTYPRRRQTVHTFPTSWCYSIRRRGAGGRTLIGTIRQRIRAMQPWRRG